MTMHCRRVEEIISVQRRQHKFQTKEYQLSGALPIVDQGASFIAGYTDETDKRYAGPLPVVIFGDHTCSLKYVDFPFAVGADGTQLLRPVDDVDVRYLYYALHTAEIEQFGYQRHFKLLKECKVPVPPLETQRRIAAILGAYDDLIEVNRRRVVVLEEMARGLFEEWFVRFRFPGHESVPILETPDGQLPEGWAVVPVSRAFDLLRGRSYRSADLVDDGGKPFVNLKCINRGGGFRLDGIKRYAGDFNLKQIVRRGDIVMAVTDMTQQRLIVGRVGRVPWLDEPDAVISMDLVKVEPAPRIDREFIYCWLRFSDFGPNAALHANGANVLHLSPKAVTDFPISLPDEERQKAFGDQVRPIFAMVETLNVAERHLAASRDLLLPRLISGQLSVEAAERELESA